MTYSYWVKYCLAFFIPILGLFLAQWLWRRISPHSWSRNWTHGGYGQLAGDAYSPTHLIPPRLFPGVHGCLIFTEVCSYYLTWVLILTADFSVYLTGRTDFDCELFCLPNLDTSFHLWSLRLKLGSRRVWPVDRGCLLLPGTWSHLLYVRGSLFANFGQMLIGCYTSII
jgi:hypothetical protein